MGETRWVAITEKDGSIRIFHKWLQNNEPHAFAAFLAEVEGWGGKLLAAFPETDVALVCGL